MASVKEMDEITAGKNKAGRVFEFPEPAVKEIREKTELSQARFAILVIFVIVLCGKYLNYK